MTTSFDPPTGRSRPRGGTGVLVLRLAISAILAALGVALWSAGHVVIGGLIVAWAVFRVALTLVVRHRRRQWDQGPGSRPWRGNGRPSSGRSSNPPPSPYQPPAGHGWGPASAITNPPAPPAPYRPPSPTVGTPSGPYQQPWPDAPRG